MALYGGIMLKKEKEIITLVEILEEWLREKGYSGMYNEYQDCSCAVGLDLMHCDDGCMPHCVPVVVEGCDIRGCECCSYHVKHEFLPRKR